MATYRYTSSGQLFNSDTGQLQSREPVDPAVKSVLKTQSSNITNRLADQKGLAEAEVNADASEYEAGQNRERGSRYFQAAMARANARRPVGGGLYQGKMTFNSFTGGGLARANAEARKKSKLSLALARLKADPENTAMREQQQTLGQVGANPYLAGNVANSLFNRQLQQLTAP